MTGNSVCDLCGREAPIQFDEIGQPRYGPSYHFQMCQTCAERFPPREFTDAEQQEAFAAYLNELGPQGRRQLTEQFDYLATLSDQELLDWLSHKPRDYPNR